MRKIVYVIGITLTIAIIFIFINQNKNKYDIGCVFITQAPAVDLAIEGMKFRLKELGLDLKIEYANAFGEPKNVNTIVNSFKQKKYGIILALTTPCAQIAKQQILDKPIIFVGVSDPVGAQLLPNLNYGYNNIVGTMSEDPIFENVKFAKKIFPNIRRIGVIYSTSESNSTSILKNLHDSINLSNIDIKLISQPITQTSEIFSASESISNRVDAIFLINDNMAFSGTETILSVADKNKIPVFASDIESVKKGALFTYGLDYRDEGIAAANILYEILHNKKKPNEIHNYINKKYYLYVNKKMYDYKFDSRLLKSAHIVK